MIDVNYMHITGRLVKEPELKYGQSGKAFLNLNVACNYYFNAKEREKSRTLYLNVPVFGATAESLAPKLKKGMQLALTGYLELEKWESNGKTGVNPKLMPRDIQVLGETVIFKKKDDVEEKYKEKTKDIDFDSDKNEGIVNDEIKFDDDSDSFPF